METNVGRMIMEINNYLDITTQEQLNMEYIKPDCMIMAGGTNLMVKGRGKNCYQKITFLSISQMEELRKIERKENQIVIGAAVTLTELLKSPLIREELPLLFQAVSRIGNCQIRNRATLVGNIANACPAADGIQALMVLDAELEISGCNGIRYMKIDNLYKECVACLRHEGMQVSSCFYVNPCEKKLNLEKGEWISHIIIKVQGKEEKSTFYKLTDNKSSNLGIVNIAMTIEKKCGKEIYRIKAAIGGMFPKPKLFMWEGSALEIRREYIDCLEKEMESVKETLVDFWFKKQVILEKIEEMFAEL